MSDDSGNPMRWPIPWQTQPLVQSQDGQTQDQAQSQSRSQADVSAAPPALRWLRVRHETSYRYDSEVQGAHHLAHLRPRDTATQRIRAWSLVVSPHPDAGVDLASGIRETVDPWGNARQVFAHSRVHDELDVTSAFEAGIGAQPLPRPGTSQPWREVARDLRLHAGASAHAARARTIAMPNARLSRRPSSRSIPAWHRAPGRWPTGPARPRRPTRGSWSWRWR
jgi:hypothetical protein